MIKITNKYIKCENMKIIKYLWNTNLEKKYIYSYKKLQATFSTGEDVRK